jgi:drug/metabolite transporter (DMT)-like permease
VNTYKGIIYALLSSAAFGIMPILASIAYADGSNSTTLLIGRFSISALILFLYLKCSHIDIALQKGQMVLLVFTGMIGYMITAQTLFMSYNYLGAGLATTLHFIYPVVVCIISFVFFKNKISTQKIISLFFAALGVYALIAFKDHTIHLWGIGLALFSGVAYGLTMIAMSVPSIRSLDNRITTMYICLGSTLGTVLYGICNKSIVCHFNFKIIACCLGIAIVSTILSIILLLKAIRIIGVSSSAILGTFEPVVSVFLGVLFLDEQLTFSLITGSALIIISAIILAKEKRSVANE